MNVIWKVLLITMLLIGVPVLLVSIFATRAGRVGGPVSRVPRHSSSERRYRVGGIPFGIPYGRRYYGGGAPSTGSPTTGSGGRPNGGSAGTGAGGRSSSTGFGGHSFGGGSSRGAGAGGRSSGFGGRSSFGGSTRFGGNSSGGHSFGGGGSRGAGGGGRR